ncbi:MAG: T9SS type A sorting domain-containing protein [Ignavibacteriae bacterium]|nr:T9SS type A sorting domain-containing protein [Ignavibacteriota bacterium]
MEEARIRNFEKWNGVITSNTYEEEIVILKGWIGRRITWIEENLPRITKIEENINIVKNEFELSQNYPNPFNPTTIINYSLKKEGFTTLKVYDILGSEITTLVNENKFAGSYTIEFDGSNLSNGVYFYTINSGNFHQTKKMILLK